MNMSNERERCSLCNRRRFGSGHHQLRRWLKPLECKHKRECESSHVHSDCSNTSPNKFIKFWKTKVLLSSVRSLQHYFGSKVNRENYLQNSDIPKQDDSTTEGLTGTPEYFDSNSCLQRKRSGRCQHSAGRVMLRGHHHHTNQESCTLYCQLHKHGWYWGGITSREAEDLLAGQHDNVFLVRDSYHSRHLLCVSYRCVGRTLHTRLRHANGLFSLNNETFVPVSRISEHCSDVPVVTDLFDAPVKLERPLNRFAKLDTLQLLCRFIIRQSVSEDQYINLPLPTKLLDYVSLGSDYIATS